MYEQHEKPQKIKTTKSKTQTALEPIMQKQKLVLPKRKNKLDTAERM